MVILIAVQDESTYSKHVFVPYISSEDLLMRIIIVVLLVSLFAAACAQPAVNDQANNAAKSNVGNANAAANTNANSNVKKGMPKLATVVIDPAADSVYTDITDAACNERDPGPDSMGIYEADCPGTAGYKLIFSFTDHSAAISVIDPQAKETLLPLRAVLKPVMNFVIGGDKVEWRMDRKGDGAKPVAMILRVNKVHDYEEPITAETFLMVVRLTQDVCVTDLVPASADQNKKAREFADTRGRPCVDGEER